MNARMAEFYASRGWPCDDKLAWHCCLDLAQRQIARDALLNFVPEDAPTFAALHEYVDANEYGWGFDGPLPLDDDECGRFVESIQRALDRWIRKGGLRQRVRARRGRRA